MGGSKPLDQVGKGKASGNRGGASTAVTTHPFQRAPRELQPKCELDGRTSRVARVFQDTSTNKRGSHTEKYSLCTISPLQYDCRKLCSYRTYLFGHRPVSPIWPIAVCSRFVVGKFGHRSACKPAAGRLQVVYNQKLALLGVRGKSTTKREQSARLRTCAWPHCNLHSAFPFGRYNVQSATNATDHQNGLYYQV